MCILFGHSLRRATQLMATWVFKVVPSGMPHRGLDRSARYMCSMVTSDKASLLELSAPFAKGLCGPLGCCGPACLAITAAYTDPPSVGLSCWLPPTTCLPVEPCSEYLSSNRCWDTGWRLACSVMPSELESLSVFVLFATGRLGPRSRLWAGTPWQNCSRS